MLGLICLWAACASQDEQAHSAAQDGASVNATVQRTFLFRAQVHTLDNELLGEHFADISQFFTHTIRWHLFDVTDELGTQAIGDLSNPWATGTVKLAYVHDYALFDQTGYLGRLESTASPAKVPFIRLDLPQSGECEGKISDRIYTQLGTLENDHYAYRHGEVRLCDLRYDAPLVGVQHYSVLNQWSIYRSSPFSEQSMVWPENPNRMRYWTRGIATTDLLSTFEPSFEKDFYSPAFNYGLWPDNTPANDDNPLYIASRYTLAPLDALQPVLGKRPSSDLQVYTKLREHYQDARKVGEVPADISILMRGTELLNKGEFALGVALQDILFYIYASDEDLKG